MSGPATARRTAGLGLLVVAVVLIGLNLRSPIVGVPPLLGQISDELELGAAAAGLLTSLPLLSFAILSPFVGGLARRAGVDRTLLIALVMLLAAIALRPWDGWLGLLAGTAVVGVAITIGNVVVPVLVRRDAPGHVSQVMALSTGAYGVGQGLATFVAVPLAVSIGWRGSITAPAVLVAVALVVWLVRMHSVPAPPTAAAKPTAPVRGWSHVWREGEAWWLAAFFGLQATLFYSAATWWPTQLRETAGLSEVTAGTAVSVFHLVGILGTLAVPGAVRLLTARGFAVVVGVAWAIFFTGLIVRPDAWVLWGVVGGLTQGAGIGLGLTLIAVRPVDAAYGRYVSGMVQGVGYAVAAVGPVVVGWLARATDGWTAPSGVLLVGGLLMSVCGLRAGADRPLGG